MLPPHVRKKIMTRAVAAGFMPAGEEESGVTPPGVGFTGSGVGLYLEGNETGIWL